MAPTNVEDSLPLLQEAQTVQFCLNRTLEKAGHDTKTNFDIAATKTARITQNASLQERSRAAGLVEGGTCKTQAAKQH